MIMITVVHRIDGLEGLDTIKIQKLPVVHRIDGLEVACN